MRKVADIELAYKEGRTVFRSFNKNVTVNTTVGITQDLSGVSGNPVAQYYLGNAGESTVMSYTLNKKGLDHGDIMPGYRKYLHQVRINTVTAVLAPSTLRILDYLMVYPFVEMTGVQEMVQAESLSRYADGEGVRIMIVEQNPYAGNITCRVTYTNSQGVVGRLSPIMSINTSTVSGTIATSDRATAQRVGDFVPFQDGDTGVRSIDSIEFFTGDVGTLALVLVRPIASIPIYEITAPNYYDLFNHFGQLPEIINDAYLNFLLKPSTNGTGAATSTIAGEIITIFEQE